MTATDDTSTPQGAGRDDTNSRPLLGLQIPQQSAAKADNLLLDPKETEAWFESLPMANIGETARRIYNTLVEFNRIEIPDLLRAKTVEKFRPPVEYITSNLQKHYIDVGLPLSTKGAKTAALARELQKELATSYKIIIERMISGSSSGFDRRLLIIALHRALHYLGQTMLQHALVYSGWPEGMWREINSIYAYASQNNIHRTPVKADDGRQKNASTSIEELFKALMLFASSTLIAYVRAMHACCSHTWTTGRVTRRSSTKTMVEPASDVSTSTFGPTRHRCTTHCARRSPANGSRSSTYVNC